MTSNHRSFLFFFWGSFFFLLLSIPKGFSSSGTLVGSLEGTAQKAAARYYLSLQSDNHSWDELDERTTLEGTFEFPLSSQNKSWIQCSIKKISLIPQNSQRFSLTTECLPNSLPSNVEKAHLEFSFFKTTDYLEISVSAKIWQKKISNPLPAGNWTWSLSPVIPDGAIYIQGTSKLRIVEKLLKPSLNPPNPYSLILSPGVSNFELSSFHQEVQGTLFVPLFHPSAKSLRSIECKIPKKTLEFLNLSDETLRPRKDSPRFVKGWKTKKIGCQSKFFPKDLKHLSLEILAKKFSLGPYDSLSFEVNAQAKLQKGDFLSPHSTTQLSFPLELKGIMNNFPPPEPIRLVKEPMISKDKKPTSKRTFKNPKKIREFLPLNSPKKKPKGKSGRKR